MNEEYYVVTSTNELLKTIYVIKKQFSAGSEQAILARNNQERIFSNAQNNNYAISCNGEIIYCSDFSKTVDNLKQEKEKLILQKRLAEIKSKKLYDLSEEEMILLADDNRVYKGITFEEAYSDLKQQSEDFRMFEQKRNQSEKRPKF